MIQIHEDGGRHDHPWHKPVLAETGPGHNCRYQEMQNHMQDRPEFKHGPLEFHREMVGGDDHLVFQVEAMCIKPLNTRIEMKLTAIMLFSVFN